MCSSPSVINSNGWCFLSDKQLRLVETKLEERVYSQPTISRGSKLKGTGSTFACIGMNHQVNSELNAERQMHERRIQELEIDLSDQQEVKHVSKHLL